MAALTTYTPSATVIVHKTQTDFVDRDTFGTTVHLVQGDDKLPVIEVELYENGKPYVVPSEASGNIRWHKPDPDRHYVYNPLLGTNEARTSVYVEVTSQMVSTPGHVKAVVEIILGSESTNSQRLAVIIDRNPVQEWDLISQSESEGKSIADYVDQAVESAASAKQSEDAARSSAASAATSASEAAKSQSAAAGSASAASTSANQAAGSATNAKNSADAASESASDAASSKTAAAGSASAASTSANQAAKSQTAAKESQAAAANSESAAFTSAANAKKSEDAAKASQEAAAGSASTASTAATNAQESAAAAAASAESTDESVSAAASSAESAKQSATAAQASQETAASSAAAAKASEDDVAANAAAAQKSQEAAAESASAASTSEQNAKTSQTAAESSASAASTSASEAAASQEAAAGFASSASTSASSASASATTADTYAKQSKSYAVGDAGGVRENENVDNSKYYYEQAKQISQGLSGALLPMGTIEFSGLETARKEAGYMYNISDAFTTDARFKEGADHAYPAGTNVYYTSDGYWDCLAGTFVTSVNGEIGAVTLGANDIRFTDGETFQAKLDAGKLKGSTGPQGPVGATGSQGPAGPTGPAPTIKVATAATVNTPGTPSVSVSQSGSNVTLTFDHLKGAQGATGSTGPAGPAGATGSQGPAGPNTVSTTTTTNIAGLLKGLSGKVAAASAGTDYVLPSGSITGSSGSCTGNAASATKVGHTLTFTGASNVKFDGSSNQSVAIPSIPGVATSSANGLMSAHDKYRMTEGIISETAVVNCDTTSALDTYIKNQISALSAYAVAIKSVLAGGSTSLGGGLWHLILFKYTDQYSTILAVTYGGNTCFKYRCIYGGGLSAWLNVNMAAMSDPGGGEGPEIFDTPQGNEDAAALEEVQRALVTAQINTLSVDDATALRWRTLYPEWADGISYLVGNRVRYNDDLYKCLVEHISILDETPDVMTDLWIKMETTSNTKESTQEDAEVHEDE